MSTTDSKLSLWTRTSSWLSRIAEVADYDSVQFTFDRVNQLDKELAELKSRIEQLEKQAITEPSLFATQAKSLTLTTYCNTNN
ncbi:MAG: hypothetical protein ACJASL_000987 [Paraglaciecola sp.]|jgi:hypothetical protein